VLQAAGFLDIERKRADYYKHLPGLEGQIEGEMDRNRSARAKRQSTLQHTPKRAEPGIEPGARRPERRMLPLYHSAIFKKLPTFQTRRENKG